MTVPQTDPAIRYVYSGPGNYPFLFRIFEDIDLDIVHLLSDGTVKSLVLGVDYLVSIDDENFGGLATLTYDVNVEGTIEIRRDIPAQQLTEWVNNDPFNTTQLEDDLDRSIMLIQQLKHLLVIGAISTNWKGDWESSASYNLRDMVIGSDSNLYSCLIPHTSVDFGQDLAEGKWILTLDVSASVRASYNWAQYPHGSPVPEGNGDEYSSFHWAVEASGGGILEVRSSDPEMITALPDTPNPKISTLEIKSDTPFGIPKLDANGKILLDQVPITGINSMGGIRGDNDCDKSDDEPGDCIYPDYRNPTQRFPNHTFLNGSLFLILTAGDMNLRDQDQVEDVISLNVGDGIIYVDSNNEFLAEGWYKIIGLSGDGTTASNVFFDDSNTVVKGSNLQIWNEAIDLAVRERVSINGDKMLGPLEIETSAPRLGLINSALTPTSPGQSWDVQVNNNGGFDILAKQSDGTFIIILTLLPDGNLISRGDIISEGEFTSEGAALFLESIMISNPSPNIIFDNEDLSGVSGQEYRIIQSGNSLIFQVMENIGTWKDVLTLLPSGDGIFSNNISSPVDPKSEDDLVREGYLSENYIKSSGGVVDGVLIYNQFPVKSGDIYPQDDAEFATKGYVDDVSGGSIPPPSIDSFIQGDVAGNVYLSKTPEEVRIAIGAPTTDVATQIADGLMSYDDKIKLDGVSSTPPGGDAGVDVDWISTSGNNSFFMLINGALYSCAPIVGSYTTGRGHLGDNTWAGMETPKRVPIPIHSPIKKVVGGYAGFGGALLENGDLYVWGRNLYGELGLGHQDPVPFPVLTTTEVVDVFDHPSKGTYIVQDQFMHILKEDGLLYAAGRNGYGQLGIGITGNSTHVWTIVTNIAAGTVDRVWSLGGAYGNLVILTTSGFIMVSGHNAGGAVGNGSTAHVNTPTELTTVWNPSGLPLMDLAYGSGFYDGSTLAGGSLIMLFGDGAGATSLRCSGVNLQGQLGTGNLTTRNTPTDVIQVPSGVVKLTGAGGRQLTCQALLDNGDLWTWGHNGGGQTGSGNLTNKSTPTMVTGDVIDIFCNGVANHQDSHRSQSFIKKADGMYSCGYNDSGCLGQGVTNATVNTHEKMIYEGDEIMDVGMFGPGSGTSRTYAFLTSGKNVYVTGNNTSDAITQGANQDCLIPTKLSIKI